MDVGRGGLAPNLGPGPIHRERAPKIKLSILESPKFFVAPFFILACRAIGILLLILISNHQGCRCSIKG